MCVETKKLKLKGILLVSVTMKINKHTAKLIVEELREVISEHINFISQDGTIIYSTDSKRISTYHEAGYISVRDNKVIEVYADSEYVGCKKGINLPVNFNGEVIASIGITGDLQAVRKYGAIIRKMTEILLKETYNQQVKKEKRERTRYYLEDLISNADPTNLNLLSANNELVKDKEILEKVICIGKLANSNILIELWDNIYKLLEHYFSESYLFSVSSKEILIYQYEKPKLAFKSVLKSFTDALAAKTGLQFSFGLSEIFQDVEQSHNMYEQAEVAWQWGHLAKLESNIFSYQRFDIELLLSSLNEKVLFNYRRLVLNKLLAKENYHLYANLIKAYVQSNGSLTACAEKLFIHKNTVQYRLNRLYQITGYNPQNLVDLMKLYLAFLVDPSK